jgi:hypothetical protein
MSHLHRFLAWLRESPFDRSPIQQRARIVDALPDDVLKLRAARALHGTELDPVWRAFKSRRKLRAVK